MAFVRGYMSFTLRSNINPHPTAAQGAVYIFCPRKANKPRMDVRVCARKCPEKDVCRAYKEAFIMGITIDMGEPCKLCGAPGAVEHGVCLKCLKKGMESRKIGRRTIAETGARVSGLLTDYINELNLAYNKTDGPLSVSFAVRFGPGDGGLQTIIDMSFTAEKIKDKAGFCINENQPALPGMDEGTP